jgi:hypothetical protein
MQPASTLDDLLDKEGAVGLSGMIRLIDERIAEEVYF